MFSLLRRFNSASSAAAATCSPSSSASSSSSSSAPFFLSSLSASSSLPLMPKRTCSTTAAPAAAPAAAVAAEESSEPKQQEQEQDPPPPPPPPPAKHPFQCYNQAFVLSQVDYCGKLAAEANIKHGVPKNVPPQANPPSDRHTVVYCEILDKRALDPSSFAYPIVFEAPPKTIPGMEIQKAVEGKPLQQQHMQPQKQLTPLQMQQQQATAPKFVALNNSFPNPLKAIMAGMSDGAVEPFIDEEIKALDGKPPAVFPLPTDEEIDTLLLETWDSAAEKRIQSDLKGAASRFTPCGKFVVKTTDSDTAAMTLQISSAVLRGAAGEGAVGGAAESPENQMHFSTPFTADLALSASGKPPTLSKHVERKFACTLCDQRFRLIDGAVRHYQTAHGQDVPQDIHMEWKKLSEPQLAGEIDKYLEQQRALRERKQEQEQAAAAAAVAAQQQTPPPPPPGGAALHQEHVTVIGEAALRATPLPEVDITVHARAAANANLCGTVVQIRTGYIKADYVAELLVETNHNGGGTAECELHCVRCFGEDYAQTIAQTVQQGARVVVTGTLRTNRHFVEEANKVMTFPYVRVVAPLGAVHVMQQDL